MLFVILSEMRIRQWTKNLFVYAAILFHGNLFDFESFITTSICFISFSLTASGIYFINDILDVESDRLNLQKSKRPIVAGKISKILSYFCAVSLICTGLIISYNLNFTCFTIILSYVILNLLYSAKLKKFIIIDVMIISYGFVSRTIIGAIVNDIQISNLQLLKN